jgi:iron complex outermembrane receptor protein
MTSPRTWATTGGSTSTAAAPASTARFGYYGYNWQHADEWAVFGKLEADLWSGATATFKPYYAGDSGERYFTNITTTPTANSLNVNRTNFQEGQFGFVAEIEQKFDPFKFKAGFWHQDITVYPPPVAGQTAYRITSTGYVFKAWNMLNEVGERIFNAPYVQANGDFGKFHATGGLKYLSANMPWVTSFSNKGVPDVSYDDASLRAARFRNAIPIGRKDACCPIRPEIRPDGQPDLRAMFGRNTHIPSRAPLQRLRQQPGRVHGQGHHPAAPVERDQARNLGQHRCRCPLQQRHLLRGPDPVLRLLPRQAGLGLRSGHRRELPAIRRRSPVLRRELEASWRARPWLTRFGAASYNSFQFTKNIRTALNSSLDVTGNQVQDVPQWMAKLGATVTYEKFTGTVLYRYIDSRYGDAQNNEYVRPYNIVDLNLSYDLPPIFHNNECKLTLDILNLFDERYIAIIRAPSDDTQTGSASYYPGAPLTGVGGITVKF